MQNHQQASSSCLAEHHSQLLQTQAGDKRYDQDDPLAAMLGLNVHHSAGQQMVNA